jgi:hypothetical protein
MLFAARNQTRDTRDIASKITYVSQIIANLLLFPFLNRVHYVEYLCGLIFRNGVEPVPILDLGELQSIFTRSNHFMPKQRPGEYEFQYKRRLAELIQHEIPLKAV